MAQTNSNVEKTLNNMSQKAERRFSDLSDRLESQYGDFRERFEDFTEQSAEVVRKHPFYSILGAAAAGILVGMVLQSRRD